MMYGSMWKNLLKLTERRVEHENIFFTVVIGGNKEMSGITFLASSKPFIIPDEIQDYNNQTIFEKIEDWVTLSVNEVVIYMYW